jgi:hypothetical protein
MRRHEVIQPERVDKLKVVMKDMRPHRPTDSIGGAAQSFLVQ